MEILNLLNANPVTLYGPTYDVALNWIGKLINWLISGVGIVGVGIILFSVILKLIVLPFDIYQRIAMRKQNQKMKDNQAKMEKLQKQYANNKDLYNQKVMEMYKESGFSMFSSCLPLILSLVIFIVAINAFNAFAQYSNVDNYNDMVNAYNAKIESYAPDLTTENYNEIVKEDGGRLVISSDDALLYYTVPATTEKTASAINAVPNYNADNTNKKTYYVNTDKALENNQIKAWVDTLVAQGKTQDDALVAYFREQAQNAVLNEYETKVKEKTSFLWIKNIWATDASYKHPVLKYDDFKSEVSQEEFKINGEKYELADVNGFTNSYTDLAYNDITAKLSGQKDQANGYYILIVLSIGTILLQQLISMRSQKEQQKYSSVDGQGASQQKIMLVVMTVMFAIFSFMYSSAFAIYMITSNVLSLLTTVIINKGVDIAEKRKVANEYKDNYDSRFRATNAVRMSKDEKNKKDNKKLKK